MKKKTIFSSVFYLCVAVFLLNACKADEKKAKLEETPYSKDLATLKHGIPAEQAAAMVKSYINFKDSTVLTDKKGQPVLLPYYATFNINEIQPLLNSDSIVGLRIYFALNQKNMLTPVLTGVRTNGKDYYLIRNIDGVPSPYGMDFSQNCDSPVCRKTPGGLINYIPPSKN